MSDHVLIALLADFRREQAALIAEPEDTPESEARGTVTYDATWAAIDAMVKTPATSFTGLAAKAAVLGEYNNPDALDRLVLSLAADCTKLGSSASTGQNGTVGSTDHKTPEELEKALARAVGIAEAIVSPLAPDIRHVWLRFCYAMVKPEPNCLTPRQGGVA